MTQIKKKYTLLQNTSVETFQNNYITTRKRIAKYRQNKLYLTYKNIRSIINVVMIWKDKFYM